MKKQRLTGTHSNTFIITGKALNDQDFSNLYKNTTMKTPTLEEVQEHFKNAKVIKSLFQSVQGNPLTGCFNPNTFHTFRKEYWVDNIAGEICYNVWSPKEGYAEILEYKENTKREYKVTFESESGCLVLIEGNSLEKLKEIADLIK